jgi:hypothetical protein
VTHSAFPSEFGARSRRRPDDNDIGIVLDNSRPEEETAMTDAQAMRNSLHPFAAALLVVALSFVGGCTEKVSTADSGPQGSGVNLAAVPPSAYPLPSANDAARFLNQASFGANDAEIAKARQYGYSAILEDQFHMPGRSHEAYINAVAASLPVGASLSDDHIA